MSLLGHSGPIYSSAISKDSRFVLSAGADGMVRLWSARKSAALVAYRGHSHPVLHVAFSPHNAHFLTGCYDGALRVFTTERRSPLRVLTGHMSDVNHAVFHPNGAYCLSGSLDGTVIANVTLSVATTSTLPFAFPVSLTPSHTDNRSACGTLGLLDASAF